MPKVQLNGTKINYLDQGSGTPLFFIHGLGGSYRMFTPQIDHFSKYHRVIAPDLRGNGASGKLTGPIHSILDRQCDDIAILMEHLEIKNAIFCGTSYGGMLCLHFALRYPNRVVGMVICDGFCDTKIYGLMDAVLYSFNLLTLWVNYIPSTLALPMVSWRYRRWPLAERYALEVARHLRKHETVLQRLLLLKLDYTRYLPLIRCPILGIVGDDFPVSIRRMKRAMKGIPYARLEIINDSFDPSNLCQAEQYNQLVQEFISKLK
jgi:3-oxoadipate enol-lactonase